MQMYGCFDGFPLFLCLVWVGNIMTPVCGPLSLFVDNVRRCYDPCCNFSIHLVTPLPFFVTTLREGCHFMKFVHDLH